MTEQVVRHIKKYRVALAAGGGANLAVAGDVVHCLTATGPFNLFFDGAAPLELEQAVGIRTPREFSGFRIESATAQTIELLSGFGDVIDARTVLGATSTVGLVGADTFNHGAVSVLVGATLIKAASAARRSLLVQPLGGDIYVGGAAVTTANGVKVTDGSSYIVEATGAVYGIRAGAANVDTRYLEEVN